MTQAEKIGAYIAHLRNEKGMTQQNLADRLGVTNKAVSKWETGAGLPDAAVVVPLAQALETTADQILRGGSDAQQPKTLVQPAFAAKRAADFLRAAHGAPGRQPGKMLAFIISAFLWIAALALLAVPQAPLWSSLLFVIVWGVVVDTKILGLGKAIVLARLRPPMRMGWTQQGFLIERDGVTACYKDDCLRQVDVSDRSLVLDFRTIRIPIDRADADGQDLLAYVTERVPDVTVSRSRAGWKAAALFICGLVVFATAFSLRVQGTWVSVSPTGNVLVMRVDKKSGEAVWYRRAGLQSETFAYPFEPGVSPKIQWLTGDACAVSYVSRSDGMVHQSVVTYGDRGNGISYYSVVSALCARWDDGAGTRLWMEDTALILEYNGRLSL